MSSTTALDCPACTAAMNQRVEHGVTIDYCPDCGGVWLDPGELEQVAGRDFHSHGHHRHHHDDHDDEDVDIDIDIGEDEEEDEDEDDGILGTIASALGGEEGLEEEGFEEEEEFGMEEEFGGEEEF